VSESHAEGATWDLPVRAFHWLLAVLVVFSFVTGKAGGPWLDWHFRSGYAILALLLFRIGWGLFGSPSARFTSFLRGPRTAFTYARSLAARNPPHSPSHNPLGGWMVVAMIAILGVQAVTGLFTNDESAHEGPLAALVSNRVVDAMSDLHERNHWLVVAAVALHLAAIATYHLAFKRNLTRAMVFGPMRVPLAAVALLALAAAAVYGLVVILPRSAS
jgi:cytochrome b